MAQSVELLLDADSDAAVRAQWSALLAAGLPSEDRSGRPLTAQQFHAPHITLYAAARMDPATDERLPPLVAGLDLEVQIGSVLVFGPRRGSCILVRTVVPTRSLLDVQAATAALCDAEPAGQFGPGHWSPHITVARRVPVDQVGACLTVLGEHPLSARITQCRRWDGDAKTAWLLT